MPFWEQVAERCGLTLTAAPRQLAGGFMHRMFAVETRQGRFAVKLLNPAIMRRPDAMEHYRRAEELEARLERAGIPILPARAVNGSRMQEVDGQYFYLFDYFEGRALRPEELTCGQTRAIGQALAAIHGLDCRACHMPLPKPEHNWRDEAALLAGREPALHAQLTEALPLLELLEQRCQAALDRLPPLRAICHGDMDCKNVLWQGSTFRIIDLECLDYGHPLLEMMQLALCWSGLETLQLNLEQLDAFLQGYASAGGAHVTDWAALFDGDVTMLDWLAYNLRRGCELGDDPEERAIGLEQSSYALRRLCYTAQVRDDVLAHLRGL